MKHERKLKVEVFTIPVGEMIPSSPEAEEELVKAISQEIAKEIDEHILNHLTIKQGKCPRCGIEPEVGKAMALDGKLFFCTECQATLCGHQVYKRSKTEEYFHSRWEKTVGGKMRSGGCGPACEIVEQVVQPCACGKAAHIVTKEEAETTKLYCSECEPKGAG